MLKSFVFSSLILFGMSSLASTTCTTNRCDNCCDTCCNVCCDNVCGGGYPCFIPRPQSWNAARELVGWQQFINKFDMEDMYGAFYITPEYTRSFNSCELAGYLFGADYHQNGNKLTISGIAKGWSTPVARGEHEWFADYFGLPANFVSEVTFCPKISNFIVDFSFYAGGKGMAENCFFKLHAPLVHTRWKLGMKEVIVTKGSLTGPSQYMSKEGIEVKDLAETFADSMVNGKFTFGDMTEELKYTKINDDCCKRTKTAFADIELALGWNFIQEEDAHLGLMIRASFPTGGKRCCDYLFAPVVGNGGHYELGGGLTSSAKLWTSDDEEKSFWFYLDANIMHLFKRKLWRTFELIDKPNSRYMLVMEMKKPVEDLYAGPDGGPYTAPGYQYQGTLHPLANITTCCTDVSIKVMGEVAAKLTWNHRNWSFDLGYNAWGRTGEKVCTAFCIEENKYALKGDAYIYGQEDGGTTIVGLSGTQSKADIHGGTSIPENQPLNQINWGTNFGVDNPQLAWLDSGGATALVKGASQMNTSLEPKFLSSQDLETCPTPAALSHKVFAHVSYAWKEDVQDDNGWIPYLGFGGEAEFSAKTDGNYSALSQWGVWVKGGYAFS